MIYQIRVKGHLESRLSAWFEGFEIDHTPDGDTLLTSSAIDQAALYGAVARCRDLGLTLISIIPIDKHRREDTMKIITEVSRIIDARAEDLYAVVADYHVGHPAILPKPYFTGLTVEKGGRGAGTVIWVDMKVNGRTFRYHHTITEPEPGRVLVEHDADQDVTSTFFFEPLNGGTRVTIRIEIQASAGFMGVVERLFTPMVSRQIFRQELENLADYVRSKSPAAISLM